MDSSKPRPLETAAQSPSEIIDAVDQDVVDACDLAALGHDQSLTRKFDIWSILALAFCVLGTWSTFAQVSTNDPFLPRSPAGGRLETRAGRCSERCRCRCNASVVEEKSGES